MAGTMHPPTLFRRPRASYPSAWEDPTMKFGLSMAVRARVWRCGSPLCSALRSRVTIRSGRPKPMATRSRRSRSSPPKPTASSFGTGIMQLAARAQANTAISANSIDAMSGGGRFAGLGVSGPQTVEGCYNQPWAKPIFRLDDDPAEAGAETASADPRRGTPSPTANGGLCAMATARCPTACARSARTRSPCCRNPRHGKHEAGRDPASVPIPIWRAKENLDLLKRDCDDGVSRLVVSLDSRGRYDLARTRRR
jgi:hypothetical protein